MGYLAVIPARGGSKRIPHKNIKDFLGNPIIAYSIETALASGLFDDVIVSTDDEEIADVALSFGAKVPYLRDSRLADDFVGTYEVIYDVYKREIDSGRSIDGVCCIYATAPLLNVFHLKKAFESFVHLKADSLTCVCEFPFPIQRAFIINDKGCLKYREPENAPKRSQDLEKCYQDCGMFYMYSQEYLENRSTKKNIPYFMPRHRVIDIDTMEDWNYALAMAKVIGELSLE